MEGREGGTKEGGKGREMERVREKGRGGRERRDRE